VAEILKFITYDSHVCRGCVVLAAFSMSIYRFSCQVHTLVASFHTMGLDAFSPCTQPYIST
jgi:hypothetical protein